MAKRLWVVGLLMTALACKSGKTDGRESRMSGGSRASAAAADMSRDAVERALLALGIDGRVLRVDLNEAAWKGGRLHVSQAHLLNDLLLLESGGKRRESPRVCALHRNGLEPRWISDLEEPTAFDASENAEAVLLVSEHHVHALDKTSGRCVFQFVSGDLAGLRRPALRLPFNPTAGAAAQSDTLYIPSLGSPRSNKNLESFSLVNGARGWGYRTRSELLTSPVVGGSAGDPKLYFVTRTGLLACMDATNYGFAPRGPRWEELLEAGVRYPLHVTQDTKESSGSVYAVDDEGVVYCLDRITGTRRWVNATGRVPVGGPLVYGNVVVVPMTGGLLAYEKDNVFYRLRVTAGPDVGGSLDVRHGQVFAVGSGAKADLALGDAKVSATHITLEVQGEVLVANCPGGSRMRVDGGAPAKRAVLRGGTEIVIGATTLVVDDLGSEPLWADLDYDRIVVRVGDRLVAARGDDLFLLDVWSGESIGGPVDFGAARLIPTNTVDGNLFAVGGDAIVYALFAR